MTTITLRNFNLAQDWWKASILMGLLIGVLFTGGYAASQGAQVSIAVNIEAQIQEIQERLDAPVNSSLAGMQKPYTEIISMVDSYYVRQNGTDGRLILPYSTNKTYIQQQSLGNVTTGSVYLKEMTLVSGLTYGSTVLVIQQYQGQLSYYSNSALVYTVKAGSLNATVLYAGILNASTNYVQTYRLLVENGTSFPSSPSSGYIFFRTDWNLLTFYNGTGWTNCTTGSVDDLTVYLLKDGSRALTGNWNVGGSYGIYGATWLNTTNINLSGNLYFNQGQAINMTLWSGTSFPASPAAGQPFFRTDLSIMYYWNSTHWASVTAGATGPAGASGTVQGLPFSYLVFVNSTASYMVNGTTGTVDYYSTNFTKVWDFTIGNCTGGENIFVKKGAYAVANQLLATSKNGITVIFEKGAVLTAGTNLNKAVIYLYTCTNWKIEGITIDGNGANQNAGTSYGSGWANGITIANCSNIVVDDANIYNCRVFGVFIDKDYALGGISHSCGVTNSLFKGNMWNGAEIGWGDYCYFSNNEVLYSPDVGLSTYGNYTTISDNFIHDLNGTTGGGGNSKWGIAVETGGGSGYNNCIIKGNIINNVSVGLMIYGDNHTIYGNRIYQCSNVDNSGAINVRGNYSIISGNNIGATLVGITLDSGGGGAYNAQYNRIQGNIISCTNRGFEIWATSNNNTIFGNTVMSGDYGYYIMSSANYTRIIENDLDATVEQSNSGTGTIFGNNVWQDGTYDSTPP